MIGAIVGDIAGSRFGRHNRMCRGDLSLCPQKCNFSFGLVRKKCKLVGLFIP